MTLPTAFPPAGAPSYQAAEAFCLMRYRDTVTGEVELIWNSRDGVTPFIVHSRRENESQHVDWRSDRRVPFHVPQVGDRIFVDLTEEQARPLAEAYVEKHWDGADYPMSEAYPSKEQAVEFFVTSWVSEWGGHAPHLIEVSFAVHRMFEARRGTAAQVAALRSQARD